MKFSKNFVGSALRKAWLFWGIGAIAATSIAIVSVTQMLLLEAAWLLGMAILVAIDYRKTKRREREQEAWLSSQVMRDIINTRNGRRDKPQ